MKALSGYFIEGKNKQELRPIRLYTLWDYDNLGANLYFAEWDSDVIFDGTTYVKFPIKFEAVTEKSGGEIDEVKITIANASREIEALLQNPLYTFKNKKVTITYVFAEYLQQTNCKYVETFFIDYYETNASGATFTLSSKLDVFSVMLPLRTVIRTHCTWQFKGEECKYDGAETSCNRTLQRCRQLNNTLNYGGFPSAGGRRMFV